MFCIVNNLVISLDINWISKRFETQYNQCFKWRKLWMMINILTSLTCTRFICKHKVLRGCQIELSFRLHYMFKSLRIKMTLFQQQKRNLTQICSHIYIFVAHNCHMKICNYFYLWHFLETYYKSNFTFNWQNS